MRRIAYELPVVGVDVVEVSPPYDQAEITSFLANRVVLETLSGIARRRRDARDGTTWDPSRPLLADRPQSSGVVMSSKAVIVGGGIAGLSSAIALHRRGWEVEVLERAPAFAEVGAGLTLWPNALRALDSIDLGDDVRGNASLEGSGGIRDSRGRWLSRTDVAALRERFGHIAMIHRATLLDILRAALPRSCAAGRGARSTTCRRTGRWSGTRHGEPRVATSSWARTACAATVRRAVWPDASEPRYAGYTAWRFVTPYDRWTSAPASSRGAAASGSATHAVGRPRLLLRDVPTRRKGADGGDLAALRDEVRRLARPRPRPARRGRTRTTCCTTTSTTCRRCRRTSRARSPWSATPRTR